MSWNTFHHKVSVNLCLKWSLFLPLQLSYILISPLHFVGLTRSNAQIQLKFHIPQEVFPDLIRLPSLSPLCMAPPHICMRLWTLWRQGTCFIYLSVLCIFDSWLNKFISYTRTWQVVVAKFQSMNCSINSETAKSFWYRNLKEIRVTC